MVLCKDIVVGDEKCYEFRSKYLGKFVKTEVMQIGYNRENPPEFKTVYTFEIPWRKSNNPLNSVPSLYATDDVKVVSCLGKGGKRTRKNRKGAKCRQTRK
jgi:hypothetical protein